MSNISDWLDERSPEEREHFLGELPRLWLEGRQVNKICRLLADFDFIQTKINYPQFGLQALIEDYDLLDKAEILNQPEYNPDKVKALKLIQGALQLSAHILATDKHQLASQLLGRLFTIKTPEIQPLLAKAKHSYTEPWLRPLTPSLMPPGGRLLRTVTGHRSPVTAVAVTPSGQQIISASLDNTIKVWNLETGKELFTLKGHNKSVNAVAVTPNGQQVISASRDKTLKVWSLETRKELFTLEGHTDWVNTVAVTPNGQQVISASSDKTLKVWNLETGKELFTLNGHSYRVNAVAVTPNGQQVISAADDWTLKVWNLETGKQLFTLHPYDKSVNVVVITPNGQQVISASESGSITVWNLETGKALFTLNGHSDWVNAVAVTPNGQQVISASRDKTLKVWNLETGKQLFTLHGHSSRVNAVTVTPNSQQVISASRDNTLKVWNLETRKELFTLTRYNRALTAVTITPDGKLVIFGDNYTLKVWNLETKNKLFAIKGKANSLAVTHDSKWVIAASSKGTIKVWDLDNRNKLFTFAGTTYRVSTVVITPDDRQVISASRDNTLKVWNLETGKQIFTLTGHSSRVNAVAVTPNGQQVISASRDKTLKVWNLETRKELLTLKGHTDWVNAVAVTPNGQQVISASRDKTLKVWNLETGKELFTLKGHSSRVNAIAVTPNGQQVISASDDWTLKVWNLETREVITTFTGDSSINCCVVAPDGVTIIASEQSGQVHFLRLEGIEAYIMNTQPFPTSRHSPSYPQEFQQVILEKTQNFVGRDFIFKAIDDFLHRYQRGYFTIVGVPGSGKSAILAQYVKENPHTIYYNAQIAGKNRVGEFLKEVCTQLSECLQTPPQHSPQGMTEIISENAAEGSWFFSLLLQQVSDKLQPEEKLIIIIDALDAIDPSGQPLGTNLFYLPRYLPDGVYFIFSRRPYKKANSGLLIEAPSQILDLSDYAVKNREDIKAYIQTNLTPLPPYPTSEVGKDYSPPLAGEGLGERSHLISEDENNFMYVHQILKAIAEGFYSQASEFDNIPPGLEAYYQQHWQKMQGEGFSDLAVELLRVLTVAETQAMSTVAIAQILKADIYDVAEIMGNWLEFLQETRIGKETKYRLYHNSFRVWLAKEINNLSC